MRATNTVFILSDEHNRGVLGCHGDAIVRTPNLDRLAARGTRFASACTNSPVCVPARASLATGRYPHQIGAWDSASPFDGSVSGWAAELVAAGHEVVAIGKLHFRSSDDPNGFSRELATMHVHDGVGWLTSLLRVPPVRMADTADLAASIGAGETSYTAYDRRVTQLACDWIADAARRRHDKPWTLFVGLVAPHFPLVAPQPFYDLYADADIPPPRQYADAERPRHPVLDALRWSSDYDDHFTPARVRIARRAYYGLCSFLDDNVGRILDAVEQSGLEPDTRIVYSTDHGDNLGHRGLWGKSVMYEDSVAVPLLVAGPDIPEGHVARTPVSLVDLHPTLLAFAGERAAEHDDPLPGAALSTLLDSPDDDRAVFSEYHDWSSITGMFMLRKGRWKLVYYPGFESQLFDLDNDPDERVDLAADPASRTVREALTRALFAVADVEAINRRAFAEQQVKIDLHGGRDAIARRNDLAYTPPPERA